jgi:hypothetical protein
LLLLSSFVCSSYPRSFAPPILVSLLLLYSFVCSSYTRSFAPPILVRLLLLYSFVCSSYTRSHSLARAELVSFRPDPRRPRLVPTPAKGTRQCV